MVREFHFLFLNLLNRLDLLPLTLFDYFRSSESKLTKLKQVQISEPSYNLHQNTLMNVNTTL